MKKIALIVGHDQIGQGAKSYNGWTEFQYNLLVAAHVQTQLLTIRDIKCRIFFRPEGPFRSSIFKLGRRVGGWGADISLELHFNSIGPVNAFGCEILAIRDKNERLNTLHLADLLSDKLAERFNLRERGRIELNSTSILDGIKVLNEDDRGYYNLRYMKDYGVKHALLIEPTFAGTKTWESEKFFEGFGFQNYAFFLASFFKDLEI